MLSSLRHIAIGSILLTPPILGWYLYSNSDRKKYQSQVLSDMKSGPKGIQTIDDLMYENVLPGDIIIFSKTCSKACSSPLAALGCSLQKLSNPTKYSSSGVIVPNPTDKKGGAIVHVLEATSGGGIVSRPLDERVRFSRSSSILLLPLNTPGERRDAISTTANKKTTSSTSKVVDSSQLVSKAREEQVIIQRKGITSCLTAFTKKAEQEGKQSSYKNLHSILSIFGGLANLAGLEGGSSYYPGPVNPTSWLTIKALQASHVVATNDAALALKGNVDSLVRTEGVDVMRDYVGAEIELRPGFRFGKAVCIRDE